MGSQSDPMLQQLMQIIQQMGGASGSIPGLGSQTPNLPGGTQPQPPPNAGMQQPPQGILGKIGSALADPNMLSMIAQGLMLGLGGKNGGYAGQGFQQAMQMQQQMKMAQQQAQNQQRQQGINNALDLYRIKSQEGMEQKRLDANTEGDMQRTAIQQLQERMRSKQETAKTMAERTKQAVEYGSQFDIPQNDEELKTVLAAMNPDADPTEISRLMLVVKNAKKKAPANDTRYQQSDLFVLPGQNQPVPTRFNPTTGRVELMTGEALPPGSTPYSQQTQPVLPLQGTGATIDERLAQVPVAYRSMVKALIDYRRIPVGGFATRDPYWKQAISYAYEVDPNYDEKEFTTRQSMMKGYTAGQQSKEINAINTVIGHVGVMDQAIAALENNDLLKLNQLANYLKVQGGQDPVTTFHAIVARVGPELTKAYVGTGGEGSEREANKLDFSTNLSPQQLRANTAMTVKLLRSKIGALGNQWKNTMQRDDFESRFISPEAKGVVERLGGETSTAKKFKYYATNDKGEMVGSEDGKTWVKIK